MFVSGPFCCTCGSHLRVMSCEMCSRQVSAAEQNEILTTIAECAANDCSSSPTYFVTVSSALCYYLQPPEVHALSLCLSRRFPAGIIIFHIAYKGFCIFQAPSVPRSISPKHALALLFAKISLGFVILPPRGFVQMDVCKVDPM